ncbi:MAG: AEC family transporter, partial [Hyphomicrobiaceae bacterium]
MQLFLEILLNITLPIVVLVVFGWLTQIKLNLSLETLKSLQLNIILPCFFVHYISTANLPLVATWPISWFTVMQFLVLLALGWGLATLLRLSPEVRPIFAIALAFPNTGNYGVPLATLVFTPDFLLHQAIIVAVQTFLIIFACNLLLARSAEGIAGALREILMSPMIWGILVGLTLRGFDLQLPATLAIPAKLMGSTYAAFALFTLGASLVGNAKELKGITIQLTVWAKLLLGPALTLIMAWLCGFEGENLI